jgi:hypothetical protein
MMATADEYAAWIVQNADKKGTPAFDTVAAAYKDARASAEPPAGDAKAKGTGSVALDSGNAIGTGYMRSLAGLAGLPVDTAANVIDLGKAGLGTAYTAATGKPAPDMLQLGDRSNVPGTSAWLMDKARKTETGRTLLDPANPDYEGGYLQAAGGGAGAIMNPSSGGQAVNQGLLGILGNLFAKGTKDVTGNDALAVAASMLPLGAQRAVTEGGRHIIRGGEEGRAAMAQRIQDLKAAGIDHPTLGLASGNGTIGATENLLSNAPGAVGIMRNAREQAITGLQNKVGEAAASASPNRGAVAAGQGIQSGLNGTFKDAFKAKQGALYNNLESQIGSNTPMQTPATQNALGLLNADIPGAPALSQFFKNGKILSLEDALHNDLNARPAYTPSQLRAALATNPAGPQALDAALGGGQLPFQAIKQTRTLVGNEIADNSLLSDVPRSKWNPLYGALSEDMQGAAQKSGPGATAAFDRANNYTRAGIDRMERVAPFADRPAPEQSFTSLASTLGENVSTFQAVKKSLPEGARGQIAGTVIERLGRATNGVQNDTGTAWSPETFLTNWNKMTPTGQRELLSGFPNSSQVAADVNAAAKAASLMRDNSKLWANPSGTAANLTARGTIGGIGLGTVGSLLGLVPWAIPAAAAGATLGSNLAARALTSDRLVNYGATKSGDPSALSAAQARTLFGLLSQQQGN